MTQHTVYFTETDYGYIVCDSKEHAEEVQQKLDEGLPLMKSAVTSNIPAANANIIT